MLAAETLGRSDAQTAAVVGAGVNGVAAAKTFLARGREVSLYDVDADRAKRAADEIGANVAKRDDALAADLLVTMTPGHEVLLPEGSLQPGQHVSLMGADGPGKAEIAVEELLRTRIFADDWEQASHNGELVHAVEAGKLEREQVVSSATSSPARRPDVRATKRSRRSTPPGSRSRTSPSRSRPSRASTASTCRPSSSKTYRRGPTTTRAVVLVEGTSDQVAVETLAERRGRDLDAEGIVIVPMGGAQAIGRFLALRSGARGEARGLCDAGEEDEFRRGLERAGLGSDLTRADMERLGFYVCVADLEDELIRALGADRVEEVVDAQGDLGSFRTLQKQPAWQGRPTEEQLRRFMGSGGSRKIRYARIARRGARARPHASAARPATCSRLRGQLDGAPAFAGAPFA